MNDKAFLIFCRYDEYCQGWEEASGYFLVYAPDYEAALNKLRSQLTNVSYHQNCTIG